MADILLTHGYFLWEDAKEQQIMKPYPPLGIMSLAAYLARAGFSVDLYDSTLGNRGDLCARFAAKPGGVLGIYVNLMTRPNVIAIMRAAKAHGWTVILGGGEAANYAEKYLDYGADVVGIGEGEETLEELLPALRNRGPHRLHDIAGIVFRDEDGRIVRTPERAQIRDIDSLPWPDRSCVDIPEYMRIWRERHGIGSVHLITARGCPYHCKWCSRAVYGTSHRRRNYLNCVDEVEMIRDTYNPEQIWYADDVFTINHRWLFDYAAELDRRNIKLPFETISRADRLMDERVLKTLHDMGCYRLWIGCESGSQRILDSMRRDVTLEQVQFAAAAAKRQGIAVGMFLMWGYDGETIDDIEATIEHVKKVDPDIFVTTVCYAVKGTDYYQVVEDRLQLNKPWEEATDRDLLVTGRHSRNYYQNATKWLRSDVEAFRLSRGGDVEAAAAKRLEAVGAREALLSTAHEVEA